MKNKLIRELVNRESLKQLNAKLDFIPTSEGFYSFTENRYIYQYRDHLGNARVRRFFNKSE